MTSPGPHTFLDHNAIIKEYSLLLVNFLLDIVAYFMFLPAINIFFAKNSVISKICRRGQKVFYRPT